MGRILAIELTGELVGAIAIALIGIVPATLTVAWAVRTALRNEKTSSEQAKDAARSKADAMRSEQAAAESAAAAEATARSMADKDNIIDALQEEVARLRESLRGTDIHEQEMLEITRRCESKCDSYRRENVQLQRKIDQYHHENETMKARIVALEQRSDEP